MNAARRRYEDYELEEDIAEDHDNEEEEAEESYSFVDMVKNKFREWFDYNYYGRDAEDEEDEAEEEEQPRSARRSAPKKTKTARRRAARVEEDDDEEEDEQPVSRRRTSTSYGVDDISNEDIKRYSERMGTRPAPMRDKRRQQVRERMDPAASERRSAPQKTTSAAAWESYRGNVKRIAEMTPRTMDNIEEIASMLMDDYAAIINLANMKSSKVNAISYLDGVSFVIGYRFEYIGEEYYICAPNGYMISHEFGTYTSKRNR